MADPPLVLVKLPSLKIYYQFDNNSPFVTQEENQSPLTFFKKKFSLAQNHQYY